MATLRILTVWFTFGFLALASEPLPNYPLVNHQGKPFQLYDLKGQHVLLSFIFTRCPLEKMCPLTVSLNKRVFSALKKEKAAPKVHFLLVTLDPDYDSAEVLAKFSKARGLTTPPFLLATGNPNSLADLASQFNVIGFPTATSTLLSHNLKTILLDPHFVTIKEFKDNEWSPKDVLRLLLPTKSP